jgi:hypothetical protein
MDSVFAEVVDEEPAGLGPTPTEVDLFLAEHGRCDRVSGDGDVVYLLGICTNVQYGPLDLPNTNLLFRR